MQMKNILGQKLEKLGKFNWNMEKIEFHANACNNITIFHNINIPFKQVLQTSIPRKFETKQFLRRMYMDK